MTDSSVLADPVDNASAGAFRHAAANARVDFEVHRNGDIGSIS